MSAVPSFSWRAVRRAVKYEFQLSADAAFESIVIGRGKGSFFTRNTWATVDEALADGRYFWRVRAVDGRDRAGRWSSVRSIDKRWTDTPVPFAPADGGTITYPSTAPVLRWEPIPRAYKYVVTIATDRQLANPVALTSSKLGVETSGTAYALQKPLAPGTYYWAVTPLDAQKHPGRRSAVWSFTWQWPTKLASTQLSVVDLDPDPATPNACATTRQCLDPQLNWDPIPGAARYQVEISQLEQDGSDPSSFPSGSVVCCSEPTTGTALSPTTILANNSGTGIPGDSDRFGYWWRVRAVDADGNAGEWNYGAPFDKTYPIRVTGLHLRDNLGDVPTDQDAGTSVVDTSSPAIVWNQVQGAASYEVNVVPYAQATPLSPFRCDWSARSGAWYVVTAGTAWTPLGNTNRRPLGVLTDLTVSRESPQPIPGMSYCVRVKPRRDRDAKGKEVVGDWATLGEPAFRYVAPPAPTGTTLALRDEDYLQPAGGQEHSWMPQVFTWKPVDGARGYFVVVARDRSFSKIVDIAFTNVPSYAPRRGANPTTYPDEGSYWWAVLPTELPNGDFSAPLTAEDCELPCEATVRRLFTKRSAPPAPVTPVNEQVVSEPPTFRWRASLGARSYTLQVDQDPAFSSPIVTVNTDSTAYTSSHAMPADTALYWRVRANDEKLGTGLGWSPTTRFRRTLPIPAADPGNPTGGEAIPVLAWRPVQGAVSYDMHVEQVDGTKRDFSIRSTAFTPVVFYGTGIWHWQVRANFPAGTRVVSGGYFAPQGFTRHIATPANLRTGKANGGVLLAWDAARMAKSYRVEIGTTDSFSRIVERTTTDNTSWAPRMDNASFADAERLYWRVAAVDEGSNVGGWATKPLRSAPRARIRLKGRLRHGRESVVRATVTGRKGRRSRARSFASRGPASRRGWGGRTAPAWSGCG